MIDHGIRDLDARPPAKFMEFKRRRLAKQPRHDMEIYFSFFPHTISRLLGRMGLTQSVCTKTEYSLGRNDLMEVKLLKSNPKTMVGSNHVFHFAMSGKIAESSNSSREVVFLPFRNLPKQQQSALGRYQGKALLNDMNEYIVAKSPKAHTEFSVDVPEETAEDVEWRVTSARLDTKPNSEIVNLSFSVKLKLVDKHVEHTLGHVVAFIACGITWRLINGSIPVHDKVWDTVDPKHGRSYSLLFHRISVS